MTERSSITFLYIIAADINGPVKIGFSHDPQARVKQLQTGSNDTLTLHYTEEFDSKERCALFEKVVHKTLKVHKKRGEWFNITVDTAIKELQYAIIRYGDEDSLKTYIRDGIIIL